MNGNVKDTQSIYKIKLPINPVPASRPRVTRWGVYYGKAYTQFKKEIQQWKEQNTPTLPKNALSQPCKVHIGFYLPLPKNTSKKRKIELDGTYCDTKQDLDNLVKGVLDYVLGNSSPDKKDKKPTFISDDKLVVELSCYKKWTSSEQGWIECDIIQV